LDLYEHMGKDIFRAHGIPTPRGIVAGSAGEAAEATRELGGKAVVKVQVQVGGRGKGGGVVVCDSPEKAADEAGRMLGSDFKGHEVNRVLCEELLPIQDEYYTSCLLDRSSGDYLVMMTAEGGMDIEQLASERPDAIRRVHVDPSLGLRGYHVRGLVECLPVDARDGAGQVLRGLFELLSGVDATLVEVNPLVRLTDGRIVALDAKVTIDDNALWRHENLAALREQFPIDPVEKRAKDAGLQYVKLDGTVGIIGNGAGLVMSTLDVVAQAGAHAANFLDIGGGASADTMATSLEVILSDPAVRTVLVNIFGGITRCDVVAQGVLEALGRIEATVPIVVRLDGTNAGEGRRILEEAAHPKIVAAENMLEAARRAAELSGAAA
jgi:succinyl-CoA synthetase beta subunit